MLADEAVTGHRSLGSDPAESDFNPLLAVKRAPPARFPLMLQVAAGRRVAAALRRCRLPRPLVPARASRRIRTPMRSSTGRSTRAPLDPDLPLEDVPLADVPLDPEPPLDPSAPLDPMPDIGVDWPDIGPRSDEAIADTPDTGVADSAAERSYTRRDRGPRRSARGGAPPPVRSALDAPSRTGAIPPTPPRSTAAPARMPTCSANCSAPTAIMTLSFAPASRPRRRRAGAIRCCSRPSRARSTVSPR